MGKPLTAFSNAPEGLLRFTVDLSVDLHDMRDWAPDTISAFWAGISQALQAHRAGQIQGFKSRRAVQEITTENRDSVELSDHDKR